MIELYKELTGEIINAAIELYKSLGPGFYEKVYEKGLYYELMDKGIHVECQVPCEVTHKGRKLGDCIADMVVDQSVIVELKTADEVSGCHKAQLINYLRATNYEVGIVLCFGKRKVTFSRVTNNELLRKTGRLHYIGEKR